MTETMPYELCFDAIAANAARIPRRAFAVAGDFLDVERFDAAPHHVGPWIDARRKALPAGHPLVVYCNRGNLPAVLEARGRRQASICVATLDGTMQWDHRAMVQFSNARLSGGPFDVSVMWHQDLIRAAAEFLT